ncbi:MAG: TIGR03936 family radical SAM-associated protein [Peptococcaceae bacterium]|nr:TIGR03936 family radical SAM-associated protein [Peptococcaceae bacterium]
MPRYKLEYAKEGPARYLSHLDLLRTFERAARRAGLPLAYTRGFNPHPKLSFAAPLAVGITGEAECAEVELDRNLQEDGVAALLGRSLPEGLRVKKVKVIPGDAPSLMSLVERSTYRCTAKLDRAAGDDALERAVRSFLARGEIPVLRKNKAGEKKMVDIRPGIFTMSARLDNDIIIIEAELKTGSSGNIRIEEVLNAFLDGFPLPLEAGDFSLFRTGLYAVREGRRRKL